MKHVAGIVMCAVLAIGCGKSQAAPAPTPAPAPTAAKADAEPENQCPSDNGVKALKFGAFQVTLTRGEDGCTVTVKAGSALLASDETGVAVYAESADLDKDGAAELIVVADSGGSSLHANNYVFTEKPAPRLVEMYDGCATRMATVPDGRPALQTCMLGFNMMDGVCNGCSPRPRIYYFLENGKLVRHNEVFVAVYDKFIDEEVGALKPDDVNEFLATKSTDDGVYRNSPARDVLMRIAANYVYSGRPEKAKEILDRYWPAFDRERIFEDLR